MNFPTRLPGVRFGQVRPPSVKTAVEQFSPALSQPAAGGDRFVKFGAKSDWTREEIPGERIKYTHPDGGMSTWAESPYGFWKSMKEQAFQPSTTLYWMAQPERGGVPEADLDKAFEYLRDTYNARLAIKAAEESVGLDLPADLYERSDEDRRAFIEQMPYETLDKMTSVRSRLGALHHVCNAELRQESIEFLQQPRFQDSPMIKSLLQHLSDEPPVHPKGISWTPAFIAEFEAGLSREINDIPADASVFQEPDPAETAAYLGEVLQSKIDLNMSYYEGRLQENVQKIREIDPALAEPLEELLNQWKEGRFPEND